MPLSEGQALGPYKVVSQLGQGGMATVYKAYHARLDRYVAIKMIHPAFQTDGGFLARFEREAQIVARLEHPHIVPVYDYNEHEGQPYLVMKFVEGRTLKRVLSAGPLPLDQIIRVMGSVADALTYAHQQGVLHRDIKPSNIILDKNDVPYLTDFGLARMAQAGESTMSQDVILGTPQYISPEQARGERNLDARTDIYSLGVILYEMVVGRVPFNADTPYAIVHDHIYRDLPRPTEINPDIPIQVEKVLLKALAKKPDDRYQSAAEMMADFRLAVAAAGLTRLDPERAETADESMARLRAVEDAPTLTGEAPQAGIPAPIPPAPPKGYVQIKVGDRKQEVEVDFGSLGRQIGEKVRQGVGAMSEFAASIEEAARNRDSNLSEEERIRRRIEKRDKERSGLIIHLVIYLVMNLFFWGLWATSGDLATAFITDPNFPREALDFPWPAIVTFFWGIGMVSHFFEYYNKYGAGAERRERYIQREIERVRAQRGDDAYLEKPKRDRRLRLTEDGELEEVPDEDEVSPAQKRKRR